MSQSVSKIVIVGGGSAGWLTAGVIAGHFNTNADAGIEVTLIESPDVKPIGVGEGTWPSMRTTLQRIGVSETDFMRECDVSLKQGSRFEKWRDGSGHYNGNDVYYHPFSLPQNFGEHDLVHAWQAVKDQVSFAHAVCQQARVCDQGLAPKQIATPEYAFNLNYGYHLDAGKFSGFLQKHCTENLGVKHILDNVTVVNAAEDGDIKSLTTESGRELAGDLFIDCTGFAALLIDKHYQVPFIGVGDILFNDTALAVQVPYNAADDPIASYTRSTTQSAGWIWDIGLPTRRGVGYTFSSAFVSEEQAEQELRDYLLPSIGQQQAEQLSTRKIPINPGYRKQFWHRNCLAVGLSAGFVEPLEASALVLVEYSAKMLAEQMPASREVMDIVAKRFNDKFSYHWQQIIDFLKLHYVLNTKQDNGYWQANRHEESIPESLQESLAVWQYQTPWLQDAPHFDELFSSASYQFVLYGMGFETQQKPFSQRSEQDTLAVANKLFADNAKKTNHLLKVLPSNRELLNKVQEFGFQKV